MNERNSIALALAYKRARAKKLKIKEIGLTTDITEDEINILVKKFAEAKAEREGKQAKDLYRGQRIYIAGLIEFAAIKSGEEAIDYEYQNAFADAASQSEHVIDLNKLWE